MMFSQSTAIPDKLYFKIGEVAEIVGVKPYVLRYWETEFEEVAPTKSKSKQRLYRRAEVERLLQIRDLLYRDKFTINGAKIRLKELAASETEQIPNSAEYNSIHPTEVSILESIKIDLERLLENLKEF